MPQMQASWYVNVHFSMKTKKMPFAYTCLVGEHYANLCLMCVLPLFRAFYSALLYKW
jgi:hypothetical protein